MVVLGHHIGISTPNLERLIDFYCTHFDAALIRRGSWTLGQEEMNKRLGLEDSSVQAAILNMGNISLELLEFSEPTQIPRTDRREVHEYGLSHICLQVEDCWSEYERLRIAGIPFNAAPLTTKAGVIFTYARDPDGNILEIIEILEGSEFPKY